MLFQGWPVAADGIYTISIPCAPARCTATVLNDRGEIAGELFDTGGGADGRGFEVTTNGLIQPLNPQGGRGDYVLPHWINTSGVLAVEYGSYRGPSISGLYLPTGRSLVNLNSVLSWTGPARALVVNDSGAVAAVSSNPADAHYHYCDLRVRLLFRDSEQSDLDHIAQSE